MLDIGFDPHVAHERRSDAFEPHGLPDAGRAGVTTAFARLRVRLLAGGLKSATGVVESVDDQRVVAGLQLLGNIEPKRGAAAGVLAQQTAVEPQAGFPIAGADVQPHARRLPLGRFLEASAIPDVFDEARPRQARQPALAAEGDDNFVRIRLVGKPRGITCVIALGELPRAVEVEPLGANHLRKRMFGPRQSEGRCLCVHGGYEGQNDGNAAHEAPSASVSHSVVLKQGGRR